MRVIVFRPESLPLDIKSEGILSSTVIPHKGHKIIRYKVDLKILLENAYGILGDRYLKDIPQLVYILNAPSLIKLSNDYSEFKNTHIDRNSRGYFSDWLIANSTYPKPRNVNIYDALDLMVKMYSEYQANKLLESL